MGQRHDLHELLKDICPNVYFQPPETVRMTYPCIVYQLASEKIFHSDNRPYGWFTAYNLTYITKSPDDIETRSRLMKIPTCAFNRFYTADGLNHYSFTIYY